MNRLAQPKRHFGSQQSLYKPMAEAVRKFQSATPERFRSKPKTEPNNHIKSVRTIPHSPHLISNKRNRPIHAISHDEQEKLDFQEARK